MKKQLSALVSSLLALWGAAPASGTQPDYRNNTFDRRSYTPYNRLSPERPQPQLQRGPQRPAMPMQVIPQYKTDIEAFASRKDGNGVKLVRAIALSPHNPTMVGSVVHRAGTLVTLQGLRKDFAPAFLRGRESRANPNDVIQVTTVLRRFGNFEFRTVPDARLISAAPVVPVQAPASPAAPAQQKGSVPSLATASNARGFSTLSSAWQQRIGGDMMAKALMPGIIFSVTGSGDIKSATYSPGEKGAAGIVYVTRADAGGTLILGLNQLTPADKGVIGSMLMNNLNPQMPVTFNDKSTPGAKVTDTVQEVRSPETRRIVGITVTRTDLPVAAASQPAAPATATPAAAAPQAAASTDRSAAAPQTQAAPAVSPWVVGNGFTSTSADDLGPTLGSYVKDHFDAQGPMEGVNVRTEDSKVSMFLLRETDDSRPQTAYSLSENAVMVYESGPGVRLTQFADTGAGLMDAVQRMKTSMKRVSAESATSITNSMALAIPMLEARFKNPTPQDQRGVFKVSIDLSNARVEITPVDRTHPMADMIISGRMGRH